MDSSTRHFSETDMVLILLTTAFSQGGLRCRGFSTTTLPEWSAEHRDTERQRCGDTEEPRPQGSCSVWIPQSPQPNGLVHKAPTGQMREHSQEALKTPAEGRRLPSPGADSTWRRGKSQGPVQERGPRRTPRQGRWG